MSAYGIAFMKSNTYLGAFPIYNAALTTADQRHFVCMKIVPLNYEKTTDETTLLTGRLVENRLWTHRFWEVVIGADELNADIVAFFRGWFNSNYKYVCFPGLLGFAGMNYYEVKPDGKSLPVAYPEDLLFLPEISMKLTGKHPLV